jgi:HAD superfamily phosphatase (TIGR01681 family)
MADGSTAAPSTSAASTPIAVAATFAVERCTTVLGIAARSYLGLPAAFAGCPYGGIDGWLQQASSAWNRARLSVLLVRPEDLVFAHPELRAGTEHLDHTALMNLPSDPSFWDKAFTGMVRLLEAGAMRSSFATLLLPCPSPPSWLQDASTAAALEAWVARIRAYAASNTSIWMRNITIVSPRRLLELYATEASSSSSSSSLPSPSSSSSLSASSLSSSASLLSYYSAGADLALHDPFTAPFVCTLANVTCRWIHAHFSASHPLKAIALDADNTLWSGAVGEAGAEGVELSPPFIALQTFMREQRASGMLLAVTSKNVESDVRAVFEARADAMPLSLERDIVALEVHWNRKSQSLRALASKLQLGLDAFIFVDDNPLECAEVATACPEVHVVQLPGDQQQFASFLSNHWLFDTVSSVAQWLVGSAHESNSSSDAFASSASSAAASAAVNPPVAATEEDLMRTQLYKEQQARVADRKGFADYGSFIASLGLRIEIQRLNEATLQRAEQLTVRTNQLNANKRPFTDRELLHLNEDASSGGAEVHTVYVADRFGAYGLVGVVLLSNAPFVDEDGKQYLQVDGFLLSCRVLNRGVEHAMARHCASVAAAKGCEAGLRVRWVPSERNEPMRAFLWSFKDAKHVTDAKTIQEELAEAKALLEQSIAEARARAAAATSAATASDGAAAAETEAALATDLLPIDADLLKALGTPDNLPRDGKVRSCRFGLKCQRMGIDGQHMSLFTHAFLWEPQHGLSAHKGQLTDMEAGIVLRARLLAQKKRIDRAFLGSLPPGATPLSSKPAAGFVLLPLERAASATMDASNVDAAAEAAAEAAAAREFASTGSSKPSTHRTYGTSGAVRLRDDAYFACATACAEGAGALCAALRAAAPDSAVWTEYEAAASSASSGAGNEAAASAEGETISAYEAACRARRKMRQQVKQGGQGQGQAHQLTPSAAASAISI